MRKTIVGTWFEFWHHNLSEGKSINNKVCSTSLILLRSAGTQNPCVITVNLLSIIKKKFRKNIQLTEKQYIFTA